MKRNHRETTATDNRLKTRICIKNVDTRAIPNGHRLREKLLKQMKNINITDSLVLPDRRLALVGLETAQMAESCVSFLNQTYALGGTQKITVEFAAAKKTARSNNEAGTGTTKSQTMPSAEAPSTKDRSTKRQRSNAEMDEVAEKRPKQSFWANDDLPDNDDAANQDSQDDQSPKPVVNNNDLEFLKSKQVAAENLEDEEENTTNQSIPKTVASRRLFVRNLPYSATESQVLDHFIQFATGVKIILDQYTDQSKGYGFVECSTAEQANSALEAMDGSEFQGRVLSVSLAEPPRETSNTTPTLSQFDSQKHRAQGWAANHIRGDAVLDAVANALGVGQGEVLSVKGDLSAGDAAVRLALGETAVIQENRNYLASHGYELDDFVQLIQQGRSKQEASQVDTDTPLKRSNTAILVKNLPFDTTVEELSSVFPNSSSILLTPSHTLAVVHFADAVLAKSAFRRNAYRRFKKSVPLYLEWAPEQREVETKEKTDDPAETEQEPDGALVGNNATLYVKNLNFKTNEARLLEAFEGLGARSVRIPQKTSTTGRRLSMGYGFIEFSSTADAEKALKAHQGLLLDEHKLELVPRKQNISRNSDTSKSKHAKTCKLMVRNIPFQANRKEILQLFGQFGTLKRVRLPKKFDASQHRGFGFVEYVAHKEAVAAKTALSSTHLYGRHLVIEYANDEDGATVS